MGTFPDKVVWDAWNRAGGRCECTRNHSWHSGRRCNKELSWANRGKEGARGAWENHHITSQKAGGKDILSNCEILCLDCHKATRTCGR